MNNIKTNKKLLIILLALVLLTAIVGAIEIYEWWSNERVITGEVSAQVIWSGNAGVYDLQTITVSIRNTKPVTSTGSLNIKIYDGPTKTDNMIADLTPDQAVSVLSGQTVDYTKTWTPDTEGSYYALATYTED